MTYIRTATDAEQNAATQLRRLGYTDAQPILRGVQHDAERDVDVRAGQALARVNWQGGPTSRADLQRLYGARGGDQGKALFFFSATPYTGDAVAYADTAAITLFVYEPDGHVQPANQHAQQALTHPGAPPHTSGGPAPHAYPTSGFWAQLWRWFVPVWKTHWRIICAVFLSVSIPISLTDTTTPIGERIAIALVCLICAPIFWKLHLDHRARQRAAAEAARHSPITARAEQQHRLYLNGDSRGIYGDHTPVDLDDR